MRHMSCSFLLRLHMRDTSYRRYTRCPCLPTWRAVAHVGPRENATRVSRVSRMSHVKGWGNEQLMLLMFMMLLMYPANSSAHVSHVTHVSRVSHVPLTNEPNVSQSRAAHSGDGNVCKIQHRVYSLITSLAHRTGVMAGSWAARRKVHHADVDSHFAGLIPHSAQVSSMHASIKKEVLMSSKRQILSLKQIVLCCSWWRYSH